MTSTENLGLRFTRMLDANPEARADFEEMLSQFREWHLESLENERDPIIIRWLQGQNQQLAELMIFIDACRERLVREGGP